MLNLLEKRHLKSLQQMNAEKERKSHNTLKSDELFQILENERGKAQITVNFNVHG